MKRMLSLLEIRPAYLAQMVALSLVAGLSNTLLLYLLSRADQETQDPWLMLGGFSLALLGFLISQRLLLWHIVGQSERILMGIRTDLFERVLHSRYVVFEEMGRDRLLSALTHDATVLSQFWPLLVNLLVSLVTMLSSLVYLGMLAPAGFVIVLSTMGVGVLMYVLITRRAQHVLETARGRQDSLLGVVNDLLDGMKELKLSRRHRQDLHRRELMDTVHNYRQESSDAKMRYHDAGLFGNGLFFGLAGLVAFVLPGLGWIGSDARFAFLMVLLYLIGPLTRITANLPFIGNAKVSAGRLLALRKQLNEAMEQGLDASQSPAFDHDWRQLHLDGLSYSYAEAGKNHSFVLGPLSLSIERGEILFIVGGNGSGKSTLGKLLTGLYLPHGGCIRLDRQAVDAANVDAYRQLFSAVFSDFHLFERLTGLPDSAQEHGTRLLRDLDLPEELLDADSGRRFSALSQGQRRRLALALAVLEDRPIYFFDEWAADQDPGNRERFYQQILPALRATGKTVIAVTHDDRFFHLADRVLRLDKGGIEDEETGADRSAHEPADWPKQLKDIPA